MRAQTEARRQYWADLSAREQQWAVYLANMELAFSQALHFDDQEASPVLKQTAWQRFLDEYGADDPFASRDEALRRRAEERIVYWRNYRPNPVSDILVEVYIENDELVFYFNNSCYAAGCRAKLPCLRLCNSAKADLSAFT